MFSAIFYKLSYIRYIGKNQPLWHKGTKKYSSVEEVQGSTFWVEKTKQHLSKRLRMVFNPLKQLTNN
jgi:hypothetical protein